MIDFKTSIQSRIQDELKSSTGYKWTINREDLADDLIQIELDKVQVGVFYHFVQQVDPQTRNDLIEKIQKIEKKIKSVEQAANYLLSNSDAADPRVLKTRSKIENLDLHNPNTLKTIKRYARRLDSLNDQEPNQKTMDQILITQNLLNESKTKCLQIRAEDFQHNQINRFHDSILPSSLDTNLSISHLPITMEQFAPPVFFLQNAIACLSLRTDEGFDAAVAEVSQLDTFAFCSPINGDKDKQILDRIYFQLYHLQNKETPSKINRKDTKWGTNAFQSDILSTPDEKLRAAQRVQIEILLFSLNSCIQKRNEAATPLILDALEKLDLHPNDLPQGQKNLSHCLFGKLYNIYFAAWKENQKMVHPHDRSFKGDFGRNAFIGEARNSIPVEYKIQAFQELIKSLQETWKI